MTSEGLGEMFEGDSADTCAVKFPLVSMGGRADSLACADPGARTPIGASGNLNCFGLLNGLWQLTGGQRKRLIEDTDTEGRTQTNMDIYKASITAYT